MTAPRRFIQPNAVYVALCGLAPFFLTVHTRALDIPPNEWVELCRDEKGARRHSSFRYVEREGYFLQWGFIGHVTEFYGGPEQPPEVTPEYDLVDFDPEVGKWRNHLPVGMEDAWSQKLPPLHMCSSYQGITTGSHRPQLKMREGVLRPDLNIVFDQVAYDWKRNRMVYFTGGRTLAYYLPGREWSAIGGGAAPPPVLGGSLCYDLGRDEIVLVGGGHVAEAGPGGKPVGYTGTWILDCETERWRPLATETEPPPRMASRLVYAPNHLAMILFGGDAQSHYRDDTWLFDTRTRRWRQSRAKTVPPARAGHFTVYDARRSWVIIGGGYNRENLTDMWAFDVGRDEWYKLGIEVPTGWYTTADIVKGEDLIILTTATKPEGDTTGCNEIYSVRTTYALRIEGDGLVDRTARPSPRQGEILKRPIEDAEGSRPDPERRAKQLARLASLPENRWVLLADPGRVAPTRTWGSCSFDTKRGQIIYWGGGHCGYGGNDYDLYDVEENTWISRPAVPMYPSRSWDKGVNPAGVTFRGGPWIRHGRKVYAYDPVSDRIINTKKIVLTAGYNPAALADYAPTDPDFGEGEDFTRSAYSKWVTWSFDPRTESHEIICSGRDGLDLTVTTPRGVMAVDYNWGNLDPRNRTDVVMYEGREVVENAVYLLEVEKRAWQKLSGEGPWPQNLYEMTALAYDSRREQLILHGGGPKRDELWTFSLDNRRWRRLEPSLEALEIKESPVCRREAVYIPSADVFLTGSHPEGQSRSAGMYAYHVGENAWRRTAIPPPEGRDVRSVVGQNRALTYDAARDIVFMVLGERGDDGKAVVYGLRYRDIH